MFEIYMWNRISPRESVQLDTVQKLWRFFDGHPGMHTPQASQSTAAITNPGFEMAGGPANLG